MSINQISLKGVGGLVSSLAKQLDGKEAHYLQDPQSGFNGRNGERIQSDTLTTILKALAVTKSLEVEILEGVVALYKTIGYSEEEIRTFLGANLQSILALYESLRTLQQLKNNGVILASKVRNQDASASSFER